MDSVIDYNIYISKYNSLAGSSYIKLRKELDHPRKGFINVQNIDESECFKQRLVRYLHPADHNPARTKKNDQILADELEFEDIKFQVKIKDIHKINKENSIGISVLMKIRNTSNLYIKKML